MALYQAIQQFFVDYKEKHSSLEHLYLHPNSKNLVQYISLLF